MTASRYVLTLNCPDRPGIVHAVSTFLLGNGCTIVESQQFSERSAGTFFMRVEFEPLDPLTTIDALRDGFTSVPERFSMEWRLIDASRPQRLLIMVSRFGHCLNDLLFRAFNGGLNAEVAAVVSNHPDLRHLAETYDVDYHHIPVTPETKPAAEKELVGLVEDLGVDLVVLARYMQILSPELCKRLEGRAINIHHSMLPSFKGGRPYHQAHARGVKLVGATAHYVTPDLDEGPIIEQEVARIDHSMNAADAATLGRDVECLALSRAVRWHTENRVLLDGKRTVVFP
ncbi:formyltetrahydrofolate deformylase [Streptomyces sp. MH60]|uniref:formyltetrahydrofolate deformylase n=1 Tax=Streptomyces sp. MH60 TaxID=1940758 RepID=UPI000CED8DA0|nr:formyltetrahydrofolate deformylase [Streptomyces sp. MH60]PPS90817.1 Formyltetrahydrofolate deformylase [Streptomyces sp. MH60]